MDNYFDMAHADKVDHENSLVPMSEISHMASRILELPHSYLQDNVYGPLDGSISLSWLQTPPVEAYAAVRPGSKIDHSICISYSMLSSMWRDSVSFAIYANNFFAIEDVDTAKKMMQTYIEYGREVHPEKGFQVLPDGMNASSCARTVFGLGLSWLHKHEASHLLQNHGSIRAKAKGASGEEFKPLDVREFAANDPNQPSNEYESWVWHVTELAADYEATAGAIQTMRIQKRVTHMKGLASDSRTTWPDIWLLFVGLTLLFFRFWDDNKKVFKSVATGSHPHPAVRYRMALRSVLGTMNEPGASELLELNIPFDKLVNIASDAFFSVTLFWVERYSVGNGFLQHFLGLATEESPAMLSYFGKIFDVWDGIKAEAAENHLEKDSAILMICDTELQRKIAPFRCLGGAQECSVLLVISSVSRYKTRIPKAPRLSHLRFAEVLKRNPLRRGAKIIR